MSDQRFIDIETKLAYQETLMEELHQVLYKQQETIDQMEKSLKILVKNQRETEGKDIGPANQKPPHW